MTVHFVHLLDALQRRSLRMASLVEDIVREACEAAIDIDVHRALRVIKRDRDVDAEEVEIEAEVVRLMALHQPVGMDLRLLCAVLKINNDLERIADCAVNVAERASYLDNRIHSKYTDAIGRMSIHTQRMLRRAVQAYGTQDAGEAQDVLTEDDAVDEMYAEVIRAVMADAKDQPDMMAAYLDVLSVAKNLERVADHATNIAEDVLFLSTGEIVRHARGVS